MVNTSLAAIIAAICATAGAFLGTLATVLYNHHIDATKRQREERDVVGRYRDALLHASEQLHSPLRFLCEGHIPQTVEGGLDAATARDSYAYCYLIYGIGRLFCWTYIVQNDIRNVHYLPTKEDNIIMDVLYSISRTLADDKIVKIGDGEYQLPFQIFRGFQAAIGEKMLVANEGHLSCMGYAAFWTKWITSASPTSAGSDNETNFRLWFSQVEDGIQALKDITGVLSRDQKVTRIAEFQNLLVTLSEVLDPNNQRIHRHERVRWKPTDLEEDGPEKRRSYFFSMPFVLRRKRRNIEEIEGIIRRGLTQPTTEPNARFSGWKDPETPALQEESEKKNPEDLENEQAEQGQLPLERGRAELSWS